MNKKLKNTHKLKRYLQKATCTKSIKYVPNVRPLDHTMGFSLQNYVQQKLPIEDIKKAAIKNWRIMLYGRLSKLFSVKFETYYS